MTDGTVRARCKALMVTLALVLAAWASPSLAQTPPEGAPPAAPPAPPPPEAMPTPPPPPAVPPPAVATEAKPPTSAEAMPATRPDTLPPIDVGAWARVGSTFQGSDPKKINDWHMSNAYVELHAGGKIHKNVAVTLNLNADYANYGMGAGGNPTAAIEDAIIQFDFDDAFHLWAGHLLVPVDRANASGPFFMIPWNYPGIMSVGSTTQFYLPAEGNFGRNNGAVVWGDLAQNKLTYLVGAFDNGDVAKTPLYSGRVRLALWDTEPGFWGNASFFGDKNMLSLGVGGQYEKVPGGTNYEEVNADVLLEKKVPGGGWFTAEGAYYHYNVADGGLSDSAYILAAFATGPIGVGNVQPMARFQYFKLKGDGQPKPLNFDAGISYLIKGPALRVLATYSYTKIPPATPAGDTTITGNAIQLAAQAIFF